MTNNCDEKLKKLEDENYCLKTVLNSINEGVLIVDSNGIIKFYNNKIEDFENLSLEETINKPLTHVYNVNNNNSEHLTVQKTGKSILDRYQRYITVDNKQIDLIASTYPVIKNGNIIYSYSISRNLISIKELFNKTREIDEQNSNTLEKDMINNNTRYTLSNLVYKSKSMNDMVKLLYKASQNNASILLYGETGTGKEIVAQGLHNESSLTRDYPFIGINCAAIPESLLESILFGTVEGAFTGSINSSGLIEQAGYGTLYLDEINSMPIVLQTKMLRVIQEKKFRKIGGTTEIKMNCRIISSTNIDPSECMRLGTLRKDLYYRLAVISITIPPLSKRVEDIPLLIDYFIDLYSKKYNKKNITASDNFKKALQHYEFDGNVRQLEHIIESCISLSDSNTIIESDLISKELESNIDKKVNMENININNCSKSLSSVLYETEKSTIITALNKYNWNVTKASKELELSRQNLQYRIKKLGLTRK